MTTPKNNAEYLRAARAKAAAEGKCATCRCRPAKPGTRYCEECFRSSAERRNAIRYIKCISCGGQVSGTQMCRPCTLAATRRHASKSAASVAAGRCSRCHREPLHPGRSHCVGCLDDLRDRVIAIRRRRGSKPRPCSTCSTLGLSGTGHNRRTHDRWMEHSKEWATPHPASERTRVGASPRSTPAPRSHRRRAA